MKKLTATLIGSLLSFAAFGQDLLQCVNPDVVRGVLFYGRANAQMSITSTLPEEMAGFSAPSGFTLIGTSARADGAGKTVAFRTNQPDGQAYAAMQGALAAEGWAVEEQITPARQVFIVDSTPVSGTLCRDGERRTLYVQNVNGRSYATVGLLDQPTARACNAQDPRQSMALGMMSLLSSQSPSLQMPEGTTAADGSNRIGTGGGGSGDTYETTAQIRIVQSAASFVGDLAAQMLEQGWAVDSSWSGTLSKGGRWTKTSADGILYWGTLELVDVGNGIHDLSFRIMISPV